MHAFLSLLVLSALADAPQFNVQLTDGARVSGSLVRWDASQLVLQSSGAASSAGTTSAGTVALEAGKLASITPQSPPASPPKAAAWIDLTDGSQLAAAGYTAEKGRAKIVCLSGNGVLELPTAEIDAVRFQPTSDAMTVEWSRIRGRKVRSDVLVHGKSGAHYGAIEDVADATVRFTLDGKTEASSVKRANVFGLIYFHATAAAAPDSPFTIYDTAGSRWAATSLALRGETIEFTSPSGRTTRRGLDQIAKIDLSCGKIVYLSDLKADQETFTPYLFTSTEKDLPSRLAFSRPRRDQNFDSKSLRILDHKYRKGMALRSLSQVAWTLPGKFSRLEAIAGIDDDVRTLGDVHLKILGDGKPLLEANISGSDKEPRPISVDLSGVRRLVLIVESLGNFAAGDYLDLGDLRLIK